jgi:hypothetical protein
LRKFLSSYGVLKVQFSIPEFSFLGCDNGGLLSARCARSFAQLLKG